MILILASFLIVLFSIFTIIPLILSVLSKIIPTKSAGDGNGYSDFACIITAYRDIECAKNLVDSLLNQDYVPYHIYLIADDCDISTFATQSPRLTVLQTDSPLHSKVKSIHFGIDNFRAGHTHLVVFDPDNLAHPSFLKELDKFHSLGYEVVQGRRVAKNLETRIACLDAFSEYYYNYTQRTVPFSLGSSATIAGSGMSVKLSLFQQFLEEEIEKEGDKLIIAEDKMMQVYIIQKGCRIAFSGNAIIFDEKVSSAHQAKRQRTRWITSYFQYLTTGIKVLASGILKLNLNQTLFAYTIILPPMFIIGLFWMMMSVVLLFVSTTLLFSLQVCMLAFVANVFLALLWGNAPQKVINSVLFAPVFILNQIKALFSMKQTKTSFLTTEKTNNISLEEVLKSKTKL